MDAPRLIRSEPPRVRPRREWECENLQNIPVVDLTKKTGSNIRRGSIGERLFQPSLMVRGRGVKYSRSGGLSVARRRVLAQRERRLMRDNVDADIGRNGRNNGDDGCDSASGGREMILDYGRRVGEHVGMNEGGVDVRKIVDGQGHVWRAWAMVGYAHAAVAITVAMVLVWGLAMFAWGVRADVGRKVRGRVSIAEARIRQCQELYKSNRCEAVGRNGEMVVPALRDMCEEWDRCMQGGRWTWIEGYSATVWAEVIAETVNAFAAKISSSSVVIALLLSGTVAGLLSIASWCVMQRRASDVNATYDGSPRFSHYRTSPAGGTPRVVRRLSFSGAKSP